MKTIRTKTIQSESKQRLKSVRKKTKGIKSIRMEKNANKKYAN